MSQPPSPAPAVLSPSEGVTVTSLPAGYAYKVTGFADLILRDAFPDHWSDLLDVLTALRIKAWELWVGGGNRSRISERIDGSLRTLGWQKHNFNFRSEIDGQVIADVRGHEVDMFKKGVKSDYPGVVHETEWNNKDEFFDRDLSSFYALHRARAIAVGVLFTRGPRLQQALVETGRWTAKQVRDAVAADGAELPKTWKKPPDKPYGDSSTHWDELMDRVALGGGGECPLFLVGVEPERIEGDITKP